MKRLVNGKSKTKCLNGCRTLNSKSLEGDQNIYILSVVKGEITKKGFLHLLLLFGFGSPLLQYFLFLKRSSFAIDEINIYL